MKKTIILAFLFTSLSAIAQNTAELSNYKYALVPSQFSFLSEKDQYSINTYTKLFMEKYGFIAFLDTDETPKEAVGKCSRVYVDLDMKKNLFVTKLRVVLKDCVGNILYTSATGSSREKEFKKSYNQALREAFKSFDSLKYKYNGYGKGLENPGMSGAPSNGGQAGIASPTTTKAAASQAVAEQTTEIVVDENTLFAQPVENGYQLVNMTPSVVFRLRKTSSDEVFIAEKGSVSGTLLKKNGIWNFEYYEGGKLVSETVKIKF